MRSHAGVKTAPNSARGKLSLSYQEDALSVHALQLQPNELQLSLKKANIEWDPSKSGTEHLAGQVAFFGIYDG